MHATIRVSSWLLAAGLLAGQAMGAGKVVYSKSPIDLKNPGAGITAFQAGDPIYGAIVLGKSVKALCGSRVSMNATREGLEMNYHIDGQYKDSQQLIVKGAAFTDATVIALDIAPEPAQMTAYKDPNLDYRRFGQNRDGALTFSKALGALAGGAHTFKVEVMACSEPVAVGEFKIQGGSYAHYAQLVGRLQGEETKTVGMSPAKRNDPAMVAAMMQAMKASTSAAWKDPIVKVVIIDPDWFIERHPISGAILFRYIRAEVAVKGGDGKCSFYKLCLFKQDFIGNRFAATRYDGHGDRQALPCENIPR